MKNNNIFMSSDLHLNHKNIIRYCDRPFKNVNDMNNTLVSNWNKMINPHDTVYYLGDLSFRNHTEYWKSLLNGRIIYIKGNHDRFRAYPYKFIIYADMDFFLTHNPQNKISNQIWTIHGHSHNNPHHPLINHEDKTINVSCDVTNYTPINMDSIIDMIRRRNR